MTEYYSTKLLKFLPQIFVLLIFIDKTTYLLIIEYLLDNMKYKAMLRIKLAMSIPLNKRMAVSIENKDSLVFFY